MISLVRAGKRFGPKVLFEDVNWLITPQDRIGLVGANGTGKTTLLKILAGLETLDSGECNVQKGITAGYLPQDGLRLSGRTVFEECLSVFEQLRAMEREMEQTLERLSTLPPEDPEYQAASSRYAWLEAHFRNLDGYALEAKVGSVLAGLGFPKEDWTRRTEHFSGGWQMRIALAKLLLEQPNLLLLDEPTNHLDLEARNWLEDYLNSYPYAFVLISHDRYFLDVTVRRIAELWNRSLHLYTGGYEAYLRQKEERRQQLIAAWKNQQERIQHLEAFINRFRYQATKARQVQSRIKELEKIERIEIPPEEPAIHFSFPQPKPSGRIVAEFVDVTKAYGSRVVLRNVNFVIERGEKIALVGVNGAGKSTLIRMLAGLEPLTSGEYRLGHNVQPEHFAQDQYKALDPGARLLDDLMSVANGKTVTELRTLLGCFLFTEDDVFKTIGVLSGGERNRYALARILLNPSNFLLLDEPTNHLDLRSKDVLLDALREYTGTLVFVSHDRYFIDQLATRVFEIENGQVHVYPGNYEDYLYRKQGAAAAPASPSDAQTTPASAKATPPASPPAAPPARKRINPMKLRQLEERAGELEETAARLEQESPRSSGRSRSLSARRRHAARWSCSRSGGANSMRRSREWERVSLELEEARREA